MLCLSKAWTCSSKAPTGKEGNTFRAKSKISFTYPLGYIVVNNQLCDTRFSIGVHVFISILLLPIDGSEGVEVDYVGIHVLIALIILNDVVEVIEK